jgi:hypothetical protein
MEMAKHDGIWVVMVLTLVYSCCWCCEKYKFQFYFQKKIEQQNEVMVAGCCCCSTRFLCVDGGDGVGVFANWF